MAGDGAEYLFDNEARQAGDRFEALASLFDSVTSRHIEDLGIESGWRCWEVGAGGGSVARWMADRVGASGVVVATDLDVQWLESELRVPNVRISRHDVVSDAPPEGEFDLVHERLVLLHVTDRAVALERLVSAVRPGGWLLLEDFDAEGSGSGYVDPHSDMADLGASIVLGIRKLLTARGADPSLGKKLPDLLRGAGLEEVGADAYQVIERGDVVRDLLRANIIQVADQLVDQAFVTRQDLDRYLTRLDDGTLRLSSPTLVSAWARRPSA